MNILKKIKLEKYLSEGVFVLAIASLLLFAELSSSTYAQIAFWEVKAGDEVLAVVRSEEAAGEAIRQAEHHYDKDGSTDVVVESQPTISVEQNQYSLMSAPKVSSAENAAGRIIANAEGSDPDVTITTTQTITGTRKVSFDTVEKKSDELIEDATKLQTMGEAGEELVTQKLVMVNGEEVSSEEIESQVTKEPRDRIMLLGTRVDDKEDPKGSEGSAGKAFRVRKSGNGKTFIGDLSGAEMGRKVAEYGLHFVGNPYVWGGESLTHGADCSGFVLAVYKHFGISLPHDAHAQRNYGIKIASLKDARAGDLICYHGHIGIYIGNNQIVHAMNEANGITVKTIGYNRKPIVTIQRLFA